MSKTIWDLVNSTGNAFDNAEKVPYLARGQNNYFQLAHDSTRAGKQREHAVNHCFAMADFCGKKNQYPLNCDWIVAASSLAANETEFLARLFDIWSDLRRNQPATWSELLREPPDQIGKRLLALTIIRILIATTFDFSLETNVRFLNFTRTACVDIFERLRITDKQHVTEQVRTLKTLDNLIAELLEPLRDASAATDLRTVMSRSHGIIQAVNDATVRGMMTSYLPLSFAKTTVPAILNALGPVVGSQDSHFVEHVEFARSEIANATTSLKEHTSFYSAEYMVPFVENLSRLLEMAYETSDAIKPARLTVESYPRKYPFHIRDRQIRLRFVVENHGPGPARDIHINFMLFEDLRPCEATIWITELDVARQAVDLDVVVGEVEGSVEFHIDIGWQNVNSTIGEFKADGILQCQSTDIDWQELIGNDPYSIDPISLESDRPFVGREVDVQQLLRLMDGRSMGCAYIYGQKRVGKTSLALEVGSRAESNHQPHFRAIYLEGGDYVSPTAEGTLQSLGRRLARHFQKQFRQFERIPIPEFSNSLTPLTEFVDEILVAQPDARYLLLLDEFDELPLDLYKRGPVGDGFFLTLRALSGRSRIGIILIGGEKMGPIIATQGDQLNRFEPMRVDYFQREEHWGDFQELVRAPLRGSIEFSDLAIEEVYRWSAGNPFYTNVICKEILRRCTDRRDAYVTEHEVDDCANVACRKAGANSFAHFWEDGVLESGTKTEDVSIQRRKILLAIASALRSGKVCTREFLAEQRDVVAMSPGALDGELKRFVERGVLMELNGRYSCRVFMFEQFLIERSAELISTEFTDRDERMQLEQAENEAYVQPSEICGLLRKWGHYGPQPVSEERVRAWLNQFESNRDRRVMFQLLKSLRFYSEAIVREKMRGAMSVIRSQTIERKKEGERSRRDLLLSHLDGVTKSGTQYARLFCTENKILLNNVISPDGLEIALKTQKDTIQAVVFTDDIIGTGKSVSEALIKINSQIGDLLRESEIKLFLFVICGFKNGIEQVQETAAQLKLPFELYCSDILLESDRAFSDSSIAFTNAADRLRALAIAKEQGEKLEKKWPLGHGDSQALVVFFGGCPNNTLPVIYKDGTGWTALFPRR